MGRHLYLRLYLVHCSEVVEDGLQLVLLDAIANHDKLLQEQQDVGTDGQDVLVRGTGTFYNNDYITMIYKWYNNDSITITLVSWQFHFDRNLRKFYLSFLLMEKKWVNIVMLQIIW